jgi:hypothetical protein
MGEKELLLPPLPKPALGEAGERKDIWGERGDNRE